MTRNEDIVNVLRELKAQDERWGVQDHPDRGGYAPEASRSDYAYDLRGIRSREARARARGHLGWDLILLEEVYEALSEEDGDKLQTELIQVAAVALQWAGAVRRRQAARPKTS